MFGQEKSLLEESGKFSVLLLKRSLSKMCLSDSR